MSVLNQIQWSKLSKRERILFVSTLVALIYSFVFFFFLPRMAERKRLDEQKRNLQQEISALSSTLPVLMRKAEAAGTPEPEPAGLLPDASLSSILEELSRLARIKEVQLIELKPSPVEKKEGYEILSVQIKIRSRFFNFGDYISALERLPRPVIIERLKIESTAETSPEVTAELVLHVYKGGGV